ncbi:MAG: hypothetical protein QXH16_07575 [Candidatus Bathyarchaeia archaeon]
MNVMGVYLGDLDLLKYGSVYQVVPQVVKIVSAKRLISGETNYKFMKGMERNYVIRGLFDDDYDGLLYYKKLGDMVASGKVYLLIVSDEYGSNPIYAFVRPHTLNPEMSAGRHIGFELECWEVPAWGRTYVNTGDDVCLLDLDYVNVDDDLYAPIWYVCDWVLERYTRYFEYAFYVRNDYKEGQDVVLEIQVPDNLSEVKIYHYKNGVFNLIGDWGGNDNWGDTKNFTDAKNVSHDVTVNHTTRGGSASNMTSLLKFGCIKRVLMKITNMGQNDAGGADSKTKYGNDQLLLRVRIFYSTNEDTTWVD